MKSNPIQSNPQEPCQEFGQYDPPGFHWRPQQPQMSPVSDPLYILNVLNVYAPLACYRTQTGTLLRRYFIGAMGTLWELRMFSSSCDYFQELGILCRSLQWFPRALFNTASTSLHVLEKRIPLQCNPRRYEKLDQLPYCAQIVDRTLESVIAERTVCDVSKCHVSQRYSSYLLSRVIT